MLHKARNKEELVDKGLVAMFLKMSPEERLRANDNAIRIILELRNACQQRKTTGPDLGLIGAGVEFILFGGLAAVVKGAPVTTAGVDIVHKQSSENIAKLLAFLKSIGALDRRTDDKMIGPTERDISGTSHALFATRLSPLDVLAVIEQGKAYEGLLEHTVKIEFSGHIARVLDLRTLVELKRASADPRDRQRLPVLEETLRQLEEE